MTLTFEDTEEIFKLDVKESERVPGDIVGYRIDNKILLNKMAFKQWIGFLMFDDFTAMRKLLETCLTFESYQIAYNRHSEKIKFLS